MDKLFTANANAQAVSRGAKTDAIIMSWKHLGTAMKELENVKGPYQQVEGSLKATHAGFMEIEVYSPRKGQKLKLVGIQEMDDDMIIGFDKSAVKIFSNGGFRRVKTPDGNEFYTVRGTTGYKFIADIEFYGEHVGLAPHKLWGIHTVS